MLLLTSNRILVQENKSYRQRDYKLEFCTIIYIIIYICIYICLHMYIHTHYTVRRENDSYRYVESKSRYTRLLKATVPGSNTANSATFLRGIYGQY